MTKKSVYVIVGGAAATVFFIGVFTVGLAAMNARPVKTNTPRFTFSKLDKLPDGTVGEQYANGTYSFCRPRPDPGKFCGKVLHSNPETQNPLWGVPNYTFTAGPGLPAGLKLNLNGNLTGTPTKAKDNTFQICAKDRVGSKKCQTVNIHIAKKAVKPPAPVYPSASIEITPWQESTLDVEAVQNALSKPEYQAAFGKLVRSYTLSAPGLTIVAEPHREATQLHFCVDTKNCGEMCGLCFGPEWTLKNPLGCDVHMTLYGMSYDKPANKTEFFLGVWGSPCPGDPEQVKGTPLKDATLVGAVPQADGGIVATVRLTYQEIINFVIVEKTMPDISVTIGAEHEITPAEDAIISQSGKP